MGKERKEREGFVGSNIIFLLNISSKINKLTLDKKNSSLNKNCLP